METLEFLVEAGNAGQRLDRFLAERELGLTRNALQQLIEDVYKRQDYEGEDFPSFVSRGDDAQQDSGYDAPEPQAAASGSKRNKVVNINATTQLKVCLLYTSEPCLNDLKQASRRYAKRQLTWFRRMEGAHWLDGSDPETPAKAQQLVERFLNGEL